MSEDKKSTKKIKSLTDVEQPGKSAASATSKPVIVTNRPLIKDPMTVEKEEDASGKTNNQAPVKNSTKPKIQPLESSPKADKEDPEPEPSDDEPTDDKPKKDKKSTTPAENEQAEAARKAEHDSNLQKIVDAKTYYLPINAVEKRKTKRFIILGILLSVLLVLIWIDIALDASLIQIDGISPLTHFFSS